MKKRIIRRVKRQTKTFCEEQNQQRIKLTLELSFFWQKMMILKVQKKFWKREFLKHQLLNFPFTKTDAVNIKAFIYGVKQIQEPVELHQCLRLLGIMN